MYLNQAISNQDDSSTILLRYNYLLAGEFVDGIRLDLFSTRFSGWLVLSAQCSNAK